MKIGKRVLKTSLAVAICLSIYLILMLIELIFKIDKNTCTYAPTNWYTPFFAGIATVYAMQQNPEGSIRQAKIRSFGSLIGGYFGAVVIFIFETIFLAITKSDNIHNYDSNIIYRFILFIITSLGILALIPFTVKLKKREATFISCLTYLSVTISIRNGGMEVFLFATNRILSTIIGVLISLFINSFPHFTKPNKDILFVSSLDNAILTKEENLTPFCKFKINNLMTRGCHLSFMTTRALTSVGKIMKDIKLTNPIIVMNGCSVYDPIKNEYSSIKEIHSSQRKEIEKILNSYKIDYFTYLINRGALCCYYDSLKEEGTLSYYNERKNSPYYAFSEAIAPDELNICQYVIIEKEEIVQSIIKEIAKSEANKYINIVTYPYQKLEGYSFLKINSKEANKESLVNTIKESEKDHFLICIGSGNTDINAMKEADFSLCLNNAPDYVKAEASYILPSDKPDDLMRFIDKIYSKSNYKKYLDKLTKCGR